MTGFRAGGEPNAVALAAPAGPFENADQRDAAVPRESCCGGSYLVTAMWPFSPQTETLLDLKVP